MWLFRDGLPIDHPFRLQIAAEAAFEHPREDLDEVISLYRDALELLPAGHINRSASLNNFASSLTTGKLGDDLKV